MNNPSAIKDELNNTLSGAYIAIDLKSFYASVECMERGIDPLAANLVVADASRTEKTICLAVSPSLKAFGIPGRARLFEVVQKVKAVNAARLVRAPGRRFSGRSSDAAELAADPSLELDYIVAPPRMALYMEYSTRIYQIYMRYVAPEDMHVYSVDEVFIDASPYLQTYGLTAHEFALKLIREVQKETGITAAAGIGPNLYLCKVAMDILAKHVPADRDGVRIAELDEMGYRRLLWAHEPITDFWRVGKGYAKKLADHGMYTMGDVARCSLGGPQDRRNEDLLYKLFGVSAELLIDHAWGWENCGMKDIKAYEPENRSISVGQVLQEPYPSDKARIVLKEMTEGLVLELVEKGLAADQVVLTVVYDSASLTPDYKGPIETDRYGREMPKQARGTENIVRMSSSGRLLTDAALRLYDRIVDKDLLIRRMYVVFNHAAPQGGPGEAEDEPRQLDLFSDFGEGLVQKEKEEQELEKEKRLQEALLKIKQKYGKNAVLPGTSYREGATGRERNKLIGGHKG